MMGNHKVAQAQVVLLLHLLGTCQCTQIVRHYHVAFSNYRMSQWSIMYEDEHLIRCLAYCSENVTCYYVSYDVIHGDCMLSQWSMSLSDKVAVNGITLHQLNPPCPALNEYVTVGNYTVAVCSQSVTKPEAASACAYYGAGRLVEPRTVQMHLDLKSYLTAISSDSVWVGAEYDSGWKFPDGTALPLTEDNSNDVDGSKRCLRMRESQSFKYADQPCDEVYGYMCEII